MRKQESKANLLLSLLFGVAVGVFFLFIQRHRRGEHFSNAAVEVVKHWGPIDPEQPTAEACSTFKNDADDGNRKHHEDSEQVNKLTVEDEIEEIPKIEETLIDKGQTQPDPEAPIIPVSNKAALEIVNKAEIAKAPAKEKIVSCRHRWTKYLRQQDPKPTAKLDELLKRYVRLHDKQLRDLPLEDALNLQLHSRNNKIRYIVWTPAETGGLAGQMLSLVSTFLFALLTDRVLLVDFPPEIEHVFCEPFQNSSWLLPVELKGALFESIPKAIHAVKQRQPMRKALLSFERGNLHDDKHLLSCHGTLKSVFGHIQWLVVRSDYTFIETIQSNRHHQHQLSELFHWRRHYNDNTFFSVLNRFLLHPGNFLWEKITSQYHIYFPDVDPKPVRIVIHPASLTDGKKHAEAIQKVVSTVMEISDGLPLSVYLVPDEFGTEWLNLTVLKKEFNGALGTVSIGSSASVGPGLSPFVGKWRRFVADVWMAGFTSHYIIPEHLPVSAVPGLLYRNDLEGVWLLADQLDSTKFKNPEALPEWDIVADRVDCSLIKRK